MIKSEVNKEMILEYRIKPSQQGSFISLPFEVMENTEELKIEMEVLQDNNTVDLGLEDPFKVRGWSGGARKSIYLREDRATPGYDLDEIYKGKWAILLNAYEINEDCNIRVKINQQTIHERWVKGDLHLHTNHSDGTYSVAEVMDYAKKAGLDFIALTDHNTFSQNKLIDTTINLAVIPGVELTTNNGHCNFYGVEKPFRDFRCSSLEDVKAVIDEGRSNQALISVNHPHCNFCPWEWGLEDIGFDYVEVWNGPWSNANHRALNWWQEQLEKGNKLIALGGSDKHGPHQVNKYGIPTSLVKSKTNNLKGLLEGISKGKVCIVSEPTSPPLELSLGGRDMGSTVVINSSIQKLPLKTKVFNNQLNALLKIYSEKGLYDKYHIERGDHVKDLTVPVKKGFYRAELWNEEEGHPLSITNPIFVQETKIN